MFEGSTASGIQSAIAQIADHSAFSPTTDPLHVPLLGGLHHYSKEEIVAALEQTSHAPDIIARFTDWQITRAGGLRVLVELQSETTLKRLAALLPKARPWDTPYVYLGSAVSIDASRHADFLEAVKAAFPLDPDLRFNLGTLDVNMFNVTAPPAPRRRGRTTGSRRAKVATKKGARQAGRPHGAPPRPSPHKKWQRGQRTVSIAVPAPTATQKRRVHERQTIGSQIRSKVVASLRGLALA